MPDSFSKKLVDTFSKNGQLCVGIDPHGELLLENGFDITPNGLEAFSFQLLDQLTEIVGIIKPQVSFFERFGSAGFRVLENLLQEATARKFLVIADAKRGDIGSTMQAYADAWLSKDAPFICDALTVNPYLGVGSIEPAVNAALERGKGLFVLAATSNPEAKGIQSSKLNEDSVARQIANEVCNINKVSALSNTRFGSIGLVVGATVKMDSLGLQNLNDGIAALRTPILAPGFGFQGAKLSDARSIFGATSGDVIYTISRSALRDGLTSVRSNVQSDVSELAESLQG